MVATVESNNATPLSEAYGQFDKVLRVRQAKAGYLLALVLMPAGISLDFFVYPHLLWPILKIRLLCDVFLLPCLLMCYTKRAARIAYFIDKPCVLLPTLAISWMILISEGALSPYYAGLNLMVIGGCLLIPYTAKESAAVCASILVFYALACLVHGRHSGVSGFLGIVTYTGTLYNNLYFLSLTSIICVTCCFHASKRRFVDFSLRHDLDVNNHELRDTLDKLQSTEVQLVQSEKLNALGKLSAGLLHEVNNPLNFTFMALQCAEQEAADNEELKDTLRDIGEGMTRIKGVIADLRSFAYPSKMTDREQFAVADALNVALRLTTHELTDIPVKFDDTVKTQVLGAKTQVIHVLMNLLVNSAHALRDKPGGRTPQITLTCQERGDRLDVVFKDNGVGVPADVLHKLGNPFFTTKEEGRGTGLGLSICHTIVNSHGGKLRIESQEGQWTQITFDLPLASAAANVSVSEQAA